MVSALLRVRGSAERGRRHAWREGEAERGNLAQRADLAQFYQSVLHHFRGARARVPGRPARHRVAQRPRRVRGLVRGTDGLSDRGCCHAPARAKRLDAQLRAHDHRVVPGEGPADRLALGRGLLHGAPGGRRSGVEQRRLAVDRGRGDRRRALLPHLQPGAAEREVRSPRPRTSAAGCPSWLCVPARYIHAPWRMPDEVHDRQASSSGRTIRHRSSIPRLPASAHWRHSRRPSAPLLGTRSTKPLYTIIRGC